MSSQSQIWIITLVKVKGIRRRVSEMYIFFHLIPRSPEKTAEQLFVNMDCRA